MVNVIDLSDIGAAREDEKPKSKGIHIAVIEPAKDPYLKKVAPDARGGFYFGILDNDSCYWPGLNHGAVIPFEMRGDKRPVAPYEWLYDGSEREKKFGKLE